MTRAIYTSLLGSAINALIASGKPAPAPHPNTLEGLVNAAADIADHAMARVYRRYPVNPPVVAADDKGKESPPAQAGGASSAAQDNLKMPRKP